MVVERERYYSRGIITNPVIYGAFSDSSDDSEPEEEQQLCLEARNQQRELERIALHSKYVLPPRSQLKRDTSHTADTQISERIKQHRILVEQMKKSIEEQNRQKFQQEMETLRKSLANLTKPSGQISTEDDQLKREIEERRKMMEKSIEEEKKKAAKAEAEKKAKEEQLRQETEQKQQAEKAEREKQERLKAQTPSAQEYKRFIETLDRYRSEYRPKLQNKEFKSWIFKEKMPLKRYIKQLQFYPEVVRERHVVIRDTLLRIKSQNMDAYHVLLNQMAKDILLQVRTEVSAISWGAYFYGRLAMLLAPDLPHFLDYLLARLYKRCPYMIPEYHDEAHLSVEERKKLQHYERNEGGFQSDDQYILYQTSYIYFFAALVQMKPDFGEPENMYGIKYGWMWLARISNAPPRPITANLMEAFLHVAAQALLQAYPRQARKLLKLIYDQILPKIPRTRENTSSLAELQRKLEEFFKTGVYPKLPERMEDKPT